VCAGLVGADLRDVRAPMAPRADAVTIGVMRDLRRLVSTAVIVSFSLAALLGIIALVSGGRGRSVPS